MRLFKSKRRMLLAVLVLLGILFVFRPGANGLRKRIVASVSSALGRRVEVQWVKLRVLPQPGFDLENFVVYDDSAYGAEPMLRAEEVTASLRLRSLFRGRLEIGRLSLKEPSFNLVRAENGHWNIEALLDRAAHTPAAPTSHTRPESRPVFPYIEADNGRINFKIGQEKKSYALIEADFALWLESENKWGMRLTSRPVRTDFNLSDTGTLRAEGTWGRSGSLRDTPLDFNLEWERAQLGQFTKLIFGKDKGWRGAVELSASLSGTPADLALTSRAVIQDFRRYDIVWPDSLRLAASCTARYSSIEHTVGRILCQSPLEKGTLILAGSIHSPTGPRGYDLQLLAQDLPATPLVALAQHVKQNLPADLTGQGLLNAEFFLRSTNNTGGQRLDWSGGGSIKDLRLTSRALKSSLSADSIPFSISPRIENAGKNSRNSRVTPDSTLREIDLGPFTVSLGSSSTATIAGRSDASGYRFRVQGESQLQRFLQAARTLGLASPEIKADGTMKGEIEVAGAWADFAAPVVTGIAQLRSVHAEPGGLRPFHIASANAVLSQESVQLQNISGIAAGTHWNGAVSFSRSCPVPPCPIHLDLRADSIFLDRLHAWLNPRPAKTPWYRALTPSRREIPPLLNSLNATGTLSASRVVFRNFEASAVSAELQIEDGKITLNELKGLLFGGRHSGRFQADLQAVPPTYAGDGIFEQVSLADLAVAMHDGWISGSGNGSYRFASSGVTAQEAVNSATGTLTFNIQNGVLSHIALGSLGPPLHARRFSGQLVFRDSQFNIEQSKLETAGGIYLVSGTATLGQKLDVKLTRGGLQGYSVTGTLASPRILPVATTETQAALKP